MGKRRNQRRGLAIVQDSKQFERLRITGNSPSTVSRRAQRPTRSGVISINKASKSMKFGCLIQNSKEQKQQKFESRKNIERKQQTSQSGQSAVSFGIGNFLPKRTSQTVDHESNSSHYLTKFLLFCLSLIFAASVTDIVVASHNLHGYNSSAHYHKSCLESKSGIWMAQELWLTEQQLPQLHKLGTQYVAQSGMQDAISNGIFRGRPYGGVSIAWTNDLSHLVFPLTNYKHKRVVEMTQMKEN